MTEKPLFNLKVNEAAKRLIPRYGRARYNNVYIEDALEYLRLNKKFLRIIRKIYPGKSPINKTLLLNITADKIDNWEIPVYWSEIQKFILDTSKKSSEPATKNFLALLNEDQEKIVAGKFYGDPQFKEILFSKKIGYQLRLKWFDYLNAERIESIQEELKNYLELESERCRCQGIRKLLKKIPKTASEELWNALYKCCATNSLQSLFVQKCPNPAHFLTHPDFEIRELAKKSMGLPNQHLRISDKIRREIKKIAQETFPGIQLGNYAVCRIENLRCPNRIGFTIVVFSYLWKNHNKYNLNLHISFDGFMREEIEDLLPCLNQCSFLKGRSILRFRKLFEFDSSQYSAFLDFLRNKLFPELKANFYIEA